MTFFEWVLPYIYGPRVYKFYSGECLTPIKPYDSYGFLLFKRFEYISDLSYTRITICMVMKWSLQVKLYAFLRRSSVVPKEQCNERSW